MKKLGLLPLIIVTFLLLLNTGCGKQDTISDFQKANRANISFDIANSGYDFEGNDVEKIVSLLKPETWEKGTLTLELSAIEHVIFYNGNMKYVVAIRDVEDNEVLFELYSATNGKWNNDSCYYKTDDVEYEELMNALREMCINE